MMYLSFIALILAIYQHAVPIKCLYINATFSATNIALNGSFNITLLDFLPNPASYPVINCGKKIDGGILSFVEYNFVKKKFQLESSLSGIYKGRVHVTNDHRITISPIKFADENQIFMCTFKYSDSNGDRVTFHSKEVAIKNVYNFPVFTSSLPSVATAIEGIQKPITCIVKSRPASNITWSHDVGVVGMATQNVMQDGYYFITTGTFTMEKPVYSMRGKKIFCTGEPKFGAPIKQNTTLNVLYRPRNTALTVTPLKLSLNTNIELTCTADGMPSTRNYRFYVNGKLIGNKTDGKLTVNVSPSNCVNYTGEYKCVPESAIGDGEMETETREFDSSVTLNASKTVNESQDLTLYCSAKDCPTSDITWKKNGVSFGGITGQKLQLVSVTRNNAGEYSCHATFWKTTKFAKMTLTVNYKPENIQFTARTLKPKNGNAVTLNCSSAGIPAPAYRMYKITGSSSTLVASSNSHTIAKINYADYTAYKATFRCESKNVLGNITKDIQLDIQVEPVFSLTLTPHTILENQSTTIECKVIAANPPATITLRDPKNSIVPLVNGSATLTNVKRESNGRYSCTAANSARPSPETKNADLTVRYKPDTVTFRSSSLIPRTGSQITLNCSSNGVPAPSYKFESITGTNTKILRDTKLGNYSIAQINYADYVEYRVTFRCTAYNTIGTALSKEVEVIIQVKPVLVISKNVKTDEGKDVIFSCNITAAYPDTKVTWIGPSQQPIQHLKGVVTMKSVLKKQAGKYTCRANNTEGTSTETLELQVNTKGSVAGKSSSGAVIGGVIAGLLVLIIIIILIYVFVIRKGSPLVCGKKNRLAHEHDIGEKENEYLPMEGVEVEKKDKNIHGYAPDDSPRVNESGSKEPILAAQGAEKPDQYTERYVLDNGTEYSTVVTRGKDHMPGVSETKKAPKDKNKSKEESHYAEFAAFNVRGNVRSPSDRPEPTQYATLEECGPIVKDPPASEYENVAQIMGAPTEI